MRFLKMLLIVLSVIVGCSFIPAGFAYELFSEAFITGRNICKTFLKWIEK